MDPLLALSAGKKRQMSEINVVPYIDVMLVLLVIFMITAPMLTQGVEIKLPKGATETLPKKERKKLIVEINQKGKFFLQTSGKPKAVDREELLLWSRSFLKKNPKAPVLVRGDHRVPYGKVTEAILALKTAGAPAVGLMLDPPIENPK